MEKEIKIDFNGSAGALGKPKTREEVMEDIRRDPMAYSAFLNFNADFKERFIEFCMGVRGVQMTYDPFFKYIFDAEAHPERLSDLLSQIIGRPLTVKRMLPNEHRRITEKGSLLIMDILVEFETGELADVEIQKIGYRFPGQRASCYASDMVMRQYEREKYRRGEDFTYRDLKKVYTIIFIEESSREFKKCPSHYIHRGRWTFDSGLKLPLLQEFFFIPLDIFRRIEDNKTDTGHMNELEAWLYFIGSDRPGDIQKVVSSHPKFLQLYEEIRYFRYHPREAAGMFSEALRILDENTVKYMIDELKQEIEEKDLAYERLEREKNSEIPRLKALLADKQR